MAGRRDSLRDGLIVAEGLIEELVRAFPFPDPGKSDARGLLAYGGDLGAERLLAAYAQGVFPWYDEEPILWFSPDPRSVLRPAEIRVSRSLAKRERAHPFLLKMDTAFEKVIRACSEMPRPDQDGTWIGDDMIEAYCRLHEFGFAHSIEAWSCDGSDDASDGQSHQLVGGLYGISLGRAFFGESMFAHRPDASKIAFCAFARQLERWKFEFIDCQVKTDHLTRFGARDWPRSEFLEALTRVLKFETRRGAWRFDSEERAAIS